MGVREDFKEDIFGEGAANGTRALGVGDRRRSAFRLYSSIRFMKHGWRTEGFAFKVEVDGLGIEEIAVELRLLMVAISSARNLGSASPTLVLEIFLVT